MKLSAISSIFLSQENENFFWQNNLGTVLFISQAVPFVSFAGNNVPAEKLFCPSN